MAQNVDVKQYSTFGSDTDVRAQYNGALGTLKSSGLALSALNLSYGPESKHNVQTITVRAQGVVGVPPVDDGFRFMMEASMRDNSRHEAIAAATFAAPAVFASGSGVPSLNLQTGEVSQSRDFPVDPSVKIAYAVLGGFSVSYGPGNDHFIKELKANAKAVVGKNGVTVTGSTSISDNNNHSGSGPIQALVIGQSTGDSTRFETAKWNTGDGEVFVPMPDVTSIDQAVVFVTGFTLNYENSDHDVRQILLDAGNNSLKISNPPESRVPTIRFSPKLTTTDGSHVARGTLDLLVMAVPPSTV